jgi:DNA-binding SARP family transcriptional activator
VSEFPRPPTRDALSTPGFPPTAVPILRISLLGTFEVLRDDWPGPARLTRAAETLFAYLVIGRRRSHARDELAGTFWGDAAEDRARNCLNTALWRIRRVLEPDARSRGRYIESTPTGDIRFGTRGGYWLDVAVFEEALDALLPMPAERLAADELGRLGAAVELYAGDLLTGVFEDWALTERERLRARYVDAQVQLMAAHRAHGNVQQCLDSGLRALVVDPLREQVHRELMTLHRDSGEPAEAVRQYELCRRLLEGQLGMAPDAQTQALRRRLDGVAAANDHAQPTANLQAALDLLARAGAAVREAECQVREALAAADGPLSSTGERLEMPR